MNCCEENLHSIIQPNESISASNIKIVNDLLKTSYQLQQKCHVSNACGIVNLVLELCLNSVGIPAKMTYGVRENSSGTINIAHVWLTIYDQIADNAYYEDTPEEIMSEIKAKAKYSEFKGQKVFLGDEKTRRLGIGDHDAALFNYMLNNKDKVLLLSMNKPELYRYYDMMTRWMEFHHGIGISLPKVSNCWNCAKNDSKLWVCKSCKVAMYCSRSCQILDWKSYHKKLCLRPMV